MYPVRKGNIPLASQIMLRSTKAKGAYKHLFEEIGAGFIRLRNTNVNFPIQLYEDLEASEIFNNEFLNPEAKTLKVIDVELGSNKTLKISSETLFVFHWKSTIKKQEERNIFIYRKEVLMGKMLLGYTAFRKV